MIRIDAVHKRFGQTPILRGVSFEVERGQTAVIIGASGGGKSTLLRCINALEYFDEGTIQIDDLTLRPGPDNGERQELHLQLRRRVGMVFQQFNLFPHFSVLQNVMSGPIYALGASPEMAEAKAKVLLERVGLKDKMDARPATLSGGQQQRVAIARALANEPAAILFDEPTSALDPRMTNEVLAVMTELSQAGQTMVVVSHAMGFARRTAHRVHVMVDGQVVESGHPDKIFGAPEHPRTRELLAEAAS